MFYLINLAWLVWCCLVPK